MFKRYAAFVVVATAITACSNEPTAPRTKAPGAAAFSSGVSSPNTAVGAVFDVSAEGGTYYAGTGPSKNGMGECHHHDDGTTGWYWVPGNAHTPGTGSNGAASGDQENGPNHEQCKFTSPGYTVTVTFSDNANYVKSPSGNMALNFDPYCVGSTCYSRDVQYKKNLGTTKGQGMLHGIGVRSDNQSISHWSIDLSQINALGDLIDDPPRSLSVNAHNDEGLYPNTQTHVTW